VPKLTHLWLATPLLLAALTLPARAATRWTFERRVARLLGTDARLARELLASARNRRAERYLTRSAAFLLATTRLSTRILPLALRSRAIRSFVSWLFAGHDNDPRLALAYGGHPRSLSSRSCPGLIPS
jgi:hypothetical protein